MVETPLHQTFDIEDVGAEVDHRIPLADREIVDRTGVVNRDSLTAGN
jgi:hypothetical protein